MEQGEAVQLRPRINHPRRQQMRAPDEVEAMLALKREGWGVKRIAREFGACAKTVRRLLKAGGWSAYKAPERASALTGHEAWLKERLIRHAGNADVVRQELAAERGLIVSLRTVERAVAPFRREIVAAAKATVRFETPPGRQLQIDFGERCVIIAGRRERVQLFVATLGYSRRGFVRAFKSQRQSAWFDGIEGAFAHFGGVPEEVLLDNAKALVSLHDAATREVVFNDRLHTFSRYWDFRPVACAPYRARTKGKDERGVGYVKSNAVAGRDFESWAAFEAHLDRWTREISDRRIHGATGESPILRFERDEAQCLRPLAGRPPFNQLRDLIRVVQSDCCVYVDRAAYSAPWRLIGENVHVSVSAGRVRISHQGRQVGEHIEAGPRARIVDPAHFRGVAGYGGRARFAGAGEAPDSIARPLADYEAIAGGRW